MFQIKDRIPMESWRLKDDLDLEDFGGSWLSHPSNAEFLKDAELALFRHIQANAELRATFLTNGEGGSKALCPKAIAIYEANSQELLKRALPHWYYATSHLASHCMSLNSCPSPSRGRIPQGSAISCYEKSW
jgi:hypothetical protein